MEKCQKLAQADAQVTNEIIKVHNFIVQPLVEMFSPSEYKLALEDDSVLREFDKLLRSFHSSAK